MGKEQLELFWEIFLLLTPPAATPVYTERKGGDWMSKNPPPLPCYARGILENVINSPPPTSLLHAVHCRKHIENIYLLKGKSRVKRYEKRYIDMK